MTVRAQEFEVLLLRVTFATDKLPAIPVVQRDFIGIQGIPCNERSGGTNPFLR